MGRWGIAFVLALVLAALGAAPASAATRLASFDQPHGGIEFAGESLLYGERTGFYFGEGDVIVRSVRPGRPARVLARERPRGDAYEPVGLGVGFAGTDKHVVLARADWREEEGYDHDTEVVYTKRRLRVLGADGFQADACSVASQALDGLDPAASADAFLAPASACADRGLALRTFSSGGMVSRRLPDADVRQPFDMAGPYAAYVDRDRRAFLVDRRTEPVARMASTVVQPGFGHLGLLSDATLVLFSSKSYGCSGRITTLTEAGERELPLRSCDGITTESVTEASGRRIAFLRKRGDQQELVTADAAGGDVRPVARFGRDVMVDIALTTNRIAWEVTRCGDTLISTSGFSPGRVEPAPAKRCPTAIPRREIDVAPNGRLSVPIRCPIGCRVTSARLVFEKVEEAFSDYLNVRRGTGRMPFELPKETLARLRRHGGLRGTLAYSVEMPGEDDRGRRVPIVLRP